MSADSLQQPLLVITGIMASGKSTVAQKLAERFSPSVHLRGDMYRKMIVNDRRDIQPDADSEQLEQLRLRYRLAASAADTYYDAGFAVIVQDVIIGHMLREFVRMVRTRPLHIVVLCPSVEAVKEREAGRAKTGYGSWTVEQLDGVLRSETPPIGLWLDSTDWSVEQTVEQIAARWRKEALVEG